MTSDLQALRITWAELDQKEESHRGKAKQQHANHRNGGEAEHRVLAKVGLKSPTSLFKSTPPSFKAQRCASA